MRLLLGGRPAAEDSSVATRSSRSFSNSASAGSPGSPFGPLQSSTLHASSPDTSSSASQTPLLSVSQQLRPAGQLRSTDWPTENLRSLSASLVTTLPLLSRSPHVAAVATEHVTASVIPTCTSRLCNR